MTYFATKSGQELVQELQKKIQTFDNHLKNSGVLDELRDSYQTFYGDSRIRQGGSQGELIKISLNHFSSLSRNLVSLVTNNRPAWAPISANSDAESQSAAILASGLLDYYMKEHRLERVFKNATLAATFLKEAFVSVTWDVTKGEIVHPGDEENLPIHEGDLEYKLYLLNDVIRDIHKVDSSLDWCITREWKNKFELASQFPEYAEKILSIQEESLDKFRINLSQDSNHNSFNKIENDLIPYYTFYYKKSAILPNGRQVSFVKDISLTDSPLAYPKIPLVKISSEDKFDSCFSHSPMLDILPLNKAINSLASSLLSNQNAFGIQNLWSKKGNGLSVSQLSGGLNLIESEEPPQALQLTASAPETYKFLDMLVQQSQLISGINDAIRGQASAGQSGASLALLSQTAIQFANGLQQSYVSLVEDVGTLSIQILQRYANTKRVSIITGKHNQPLLKEWSAQSLSSVSRITIESGNALSKTTSGRLTMADSLMQAGMIKHPEQYLSLLQTGNLSPMLESDTSQLLRIRKENEMMVDEKSPVALATDDHALDIKEHLTILDNPDVRANPTLVNTVLSHVQNHIDLAKSIDPTLAAILGRQVYQPVQPPNVNPTNGQPSEVTNGQNVVTQEAQKVNMPNFPVNPVNGEEFNPSQQ